MNRFGGGEVFDINAPRHISSYSFPNERVESPAIG